MQAEDRSSGCDSVAVLLGVAHHFVVWEKTMQRRNLLTATLASLALAVTSAIPVAAQEVTLRMHSFLPPQSVLANEIMKPFADRVVAASDGRIAIQQFDSMSLGGRPTDLIDQARDGVADIVLTLPGYTPGRFPRTEVFELPFMMADPVGTSKAFQQMIEEDFQASEYGDFKILTAWVHGPGVIHTAEPVNSLEDMAGKTLRGPTRIINELLAELGAEPIGMPVPAVPEALSKGVINGTVIPWEVTKTLRLTELVGNHTEFTGPEALYTATFVFAMNKASYEALPDDLRAIIDAESGQMMAGMSSASMVEFDAPAREIAIEAGSNIVALEADEIARWKEAAQPVVDRWVAEMDEKGIDGQALIDRAKALIAEHSN